MAGACEVNSGMRPIHRVWLAIFVFCSDGCSNRVQPKDIEGRWEMTSASSAFLKLDRVPRLRIEGGGQVSAECFPVGSNRNGWTCLDGVGKWSVASNDERSIQLLFESGDILFGSRLFFPASDPSIAIFTWHREEGEIPIHFVRVR